MSNGQGDADATTEVARGPLTERTGDDSVDRALAALDGLDDQPLDAHVRAAERVHERLQSRLSDLGDG